MKYRKIEIDEECWSAGHDLEQHSPFSLKLNGDKEPATIDLAGVTVGRFNESMALPVKAVRHDFMEEDGYRVDTRSVIPFGSEPAVLRKFEYYSNIIKITTDIRVKAPVEGNVFSIDELLLQGKWKRFAVIGASKKKQINDKIKWKKASVSESPLYESKNLFGIILLESEDGVRIEIGTGFDIWRWNIAQEMEDVDGKLIIELNKEGSVIIKRHIMCAENDFVIPKREWRFNWYMAWDTGADSVSDSAVEPTTISVNKFEWSDAGLVKEGDSILSAPCLHSKAARNRLKKWIRSQLDISRGKEVRIIDVKPHICGNPAHLERPKYDELLHWDLPDIIDLWFWANRQLRKKESLFSLLPEKNGVFEHLPSFKNMK
jgi:hypothetical protein